jgi:1,4-dihydroxy-2-naphthoyl-CoA hydrolase
MVDQDATELIHKLAPLAKELGIEVLSQAPDEVRARLAWSERLCTAGGVLHGGTIMALADTTGAACALLNLPEGNQGTTTVESKTNFLRALSEGYATATARPLHKGRRFVVVETEVADDRGKLVAKTTQTQAVL